MLSVPLPGIGELSLEHLVLDANGTLTDRGELLDGVDVALGRAGDALALHVLSADTFGTAEALADQVGASFHRVETGSDKRQYVELLGADTCVAVGNGRNDVHMLEVAALGIAVLGPEGTATEAVAMADVVTRSVQEALALLADPRVLTATLRT